MNDVVRMADDQAKCSHTPGPWTAEAVVGDDMHDICGPSSPGQGCPNLLASVAYDADDPLPHLSLAEANANARLIAAAPELLQGMKDLYRAYVNLLEAGRDRIATYGGQCDSVETMERGDPWLKKARDVVAKAEGRS